MRSTYIAFALALFIIYFSLVNAFCIGLFFKNGEELLENGDYKKAAEKFLSKKKYISAFLSDTDRDDIEKALRENDFDALSFYYKEAENGILPRLFDLLILTFDGFRDNI